MYIRDNLRREEVESHRFGTVGVNSGLEGSFVVRPEGRRRGRGEG